MLRKVKGQVITAGYDWAIQVSFEKAGFTIPVGAKFIAHVRRDPGVDDVLATLTTENSGLTRISDKVLQIRLPGSMSNGWPERLAYIDVVRVDGGRKDHLGFMLTIPVRRPITRGI